jgi:hypothetical protein
MACIRDENGKVIGFYRPKKGTPEYVEKENGGMFQG